MKNILNKSILFLVLFLLLSMLTFAGNYTWTGSTSTAWSTATNWSPAQVPSTNDTVTIVTGSNNTNLTSNTTVKVFTINSGTVDMRGFKLKVSGNANFNSGTITNGQLTLNGTSEVYFSGTLIDAVTKVSDRFIYLNGSTFSDSLTIVKTGDQPDNSKGGNTFNGYVSLVDSFTGAMVLSDSFPDTFNSILSVNNVSTGGIYLAHRGTGNQFNGNVTFLGTKIYSNYYGTATYGGNITISCGSGEVYFGYSTGSCSLVSGKTISLSGPDFSSGNLYFRNFTQLDTTTTISLTLLGTSHLYFESGSAFNAPVTCSAPLLYLDGTKFYRTTSLTNTGSTNVTSTGGCYFGGLTTINNNPASSITYSLANTTIDTFATTATIQNSKGIIDFNNGLFNGNVTLKNLDSSDTNVRFYVSNSGATKFKGTLTIDNHGSNMVFGKSGGTTILDSSQVISFVSGFSGNIQLAYFSQRGSTSQSFTFPGSGSELILGSSSSFDGSVTFYGQSIELDGTTFNGTTSITRYGSSGNTCYGGNVFNGTTTILDSSSSSNNFIMANSSADDFNGNATFIQKGTSVNIYPSYTKNSTFAGSIMVDGSSAISFGANGGKAIIDGSSSQSINNSGSFTPSFKKIEVNKSGGALTLNTPLSISDSLILLKGIINSDTTNIVTLANGGIVTSASDSSFVNGPFKKIGNAAFIFPIGYDVSNGFHPLEITAPSSTTDAYTAQYFHIGQSLGSTLDTTIENLSACQYWSLTRNTGTSKVRIKLNWNYDSCGIIDPQYMRIAGWNGSLWKDFSSYAYSGDSLKGSSTTLDSATAISIFTLANKRCIYFKDAITSHDVFCHGGTDGMAMVTVSGGTPPYSYNWSNSMGTAATTPMLLYAGQFNVSISDTLGCHLSDSTTIYEPDTLILSFSTTHYSSCGDSTGVVTATATGGTGVLKKYFWTNDGTTDRSHVNLPAGEYTVLVTDSNACAVFGTVQVSDTNGPIVTLNYETPVTCFGGTNGGAKINVSSGTEPYTYKWSTSANDTLDSIANVPGGIYSIRVIDSLSCVTYDTVEITQPDTFRVNVSVTNTHCGANEGTVTAIVTGGTEEYSYTWLPEGLSPESEITNLNSGTGTITVTDGNGCTTFSNYEILDLDGPEITGHVITDVTCALGSNGSARVTVEGGTSPYTYSWFPEGGDSDTALNLYSDNYTVTIVDANGCRQKTDIYIGSPDQLEIDISKIFPSGEETNDGVSSAIVYGGVAPYTYLWNNGSSTTNITSRTYDTDTLVVTDANGCITTSVSRSSPLIHGGLCPYYNTPPTCVDTSTCAGCSSVTKTITTDFGADGSDSSSDECAFEKAAYFFSGLDSSTIKTLIIPAGTYYIGRQDTGTFQGIPNYWLKGHNVLDFSHVNNLSIIGDIDIHGNPASILRLNTCMRYGAFDPSTGDRLISYGGSDTSSACIAAHLTPNDYYLLATIGDMIYLNYCNRINIQNIELDGNIENTIIGGGYSEGMQQGGYAGITMNAARNVNIINVRCHHFGYDGLTVRDSYCQPSSWVDINAITLNLVIIKSVFSYNARNNMTWAGGLGVTAYGSEFSHAGRSRYISKPGAGLDIEYEGSSGGTGYPNSNGVFNNCIFDYNYNYGMISDVDYFMSKNYQFIYCTFIGPYIAMQNTSRKMLFDSCYFVGTVNNHYGAPLAHPVIPGVFQLNQDNQTRFRYCQFNEEYNVPGVGRRSFQQTDDEYTSCPADSFHTFMLNIVGSFRTEFSFCNTQTNYTMKDGYFECMPADTHIVYPSYNNIQMRRTAFYNHGLNSCKCDHELSSLYNVNFIGDYNGDVVMHLIGLRTNPAGCSIYNYFGVNNSYYNSYTIDPITGDPGLFTQAYCCDTIWDSVPKFVHPVDPLPVTDLFSFSSTTPEYTTTSGIQSFCIDPPERKRNPLITSPNPDIFIYPNPVSNILNIENIKSNSLILISNILGSEVIKKIAGGNKEQININSLRPGIYFVHTSEGQNKKFVKQ